METDRRGRLAAGLAATLGVLLVLAIPAAHSASAKAAKDRDGDGLSDRYEVKKSRTNPGRKDTDRDRLSDRKELRKYKTNPRRRDTDRDGISDWGELRKLKTDPRRKDTDGDGISDGKELRRGSDPLGRTRPRPARTTPTGPRARIPPPATSPAWAR
jgi:hypothetical protein